MQNALKINKVCTRCKTEKPIEEFPGKKSWCRRCKADHSNERYHKKKNDVEWMNNRRNNQRLWREDNRDSYNAKSREWWNNNPEARKSCWRRYKYGLDDDTYKKLVLEAKNICPICNNFTEKLDIDHDHRTDKFRGLICGWCNRAIGLLRDNFIIAQNASNWLRMHSSTPSELAKEKMHNA